MNSSIVASNTREKLQKKLQKKQQIKIEEEKKIKDEFSYLLSMMCFGYSICEAIENRKSEIDLGVDIDKGQPSVYSIKNIDNILNEFNDEYRKYIQLLQSEFDKNYENCVINSNFLIAISDGCDRNEPIEEIQKNIDKHGGKFSFNELAASSSEFIMNIFNNDKNKFKWIFDIINRMDYYKKLKVTADCFVCNSKENLHYCSCRNIAYCSSECQRYDWSTHKLSCKFYFKENCKKEFNYIIEQPFGPLSFSKKKLDKEKKDLLDDINSLIIDYMSTNDKINLLEDKYAFSLIVKSREILFTINKLSKCGGNLSIYKHNELAIKELKKLHILYV